MKSIRDQLRATAKRVTEQNTGYDYVERDYDPDGDGYFERHRDDVDSDSSLDDGYANGGVAELRNIDAIYPCSTEEGLLALWTLRAYKQAYNVRNLLRKRGEHPSIVEDIQRNRLPELERDWARYGLPNTCAYFAGISFAEDEQERKRKKR